MNSNKYVVISSQTKQDIEKCKYFNLDTKEFTNINLKNCIEKEKCIIKDINKAVTQFIVVPLPKMETNEVCYDELVKFESKRGTGWSRK